jgi:hypothetical protein
LIAILISVGGPEACAPTRVSECPAELAFGFGVRCTAALGHHHDRRLAADDPGNGSRDVIGRFGIEGDSESGVYWGGLVVDDVVDAGRAPLEDKLGRGGRIVEVDK